MKWSDKEEEALMLCQQRGGGWPQIAALAVELAAARGGTMTAEELAWLAPAQDEPLNTIYQKVLALGARIAVLEAGQNGSALTHRERETLAAALHEVESERAGIMASVTMPATVDPGWKLRIVGGGLNCLSKAIPQLLQAVRSTLQQPATPGHPERVKERSEAFNGDADVCEHRVDRRDTCGDCEYERGEKNGAEAMRAACLKDVRDALANVGAWDRETERIVAAAIEGATP